MSALKRRLRLSAARIEELRAAGFSNAAIRGHARPGERTVSGRPPKSDLLLNTAIERVKSGDALTWVARDLHISRERLRWGVAGQGDYVRQGRRYRFVPKTRFDLPLYSAGESIRVVVDDDNAARLGAFMAAVGKFLRSNKIEHLAPFAGLGISDVSGRFHPFETDPEALYELAAKGEAVFHRIYQLSGA